MACSLSYSAVWAGGARKSLVTLGCAWLASGSPQGLVVTLCSVVGPEDRPLSLPCSDALGAGDVLSPEKAARIYGFAATTCCP